MKTLVVLLAFLGPYPNVTDVVYIKSFQGRGECSLFLKERGANISTTLKGPHILKCVTPPARWWA